jgi:hypothetical protein
MKVHGIEIPETAIDAAVMRMRAGDFTAYAIECLFEAHGVSRSGYGTAMRTADRLIQKMRKAGNIEFYDRRRSLWRWVGGE